MCVKEWVNKGIKPVPVDLSWFMPNGIVWADRFQTARLRLRIYEGRADEECTSQYLKDLWWFHMASVVW